MRHLLIFGHLFNHSKRLLPVGVCAGSSATRET